MKTFTVVTLILVLSGEVAAEPDTYVAEPLDVSQLDSDYGFDYSGKQPINLSGITQVGKNIYIVGDKAHDSYLYRVEKVGQYWKISQRIELNTDHPASFEGVTSAGKYVFLVNEDPVAVYLYDLCGLAAKRIELSINLGAFEKVMHAAGKHNRGFEGIAFDEQHNRLYLAKEREPAYVLIVNLSESRKSGVVSGQIEIANKEIAQAPSSATR